jgi:hypothetical protein
MQAALRRLEIQEAPRPEAAVLVVPTEPVTRDRNQQPVFLVEEAEVQTEAARLLRLLLAGTVA